MKPEFYVMKIGREVDPNKPIIGNRPQQAQRIGRVDRALAQPRAFALDEGEGPPNQVAEGWQDVNGFGEELSRAAMRDPVIRFSTQEAAEVYAKQLAEKNPKVLYGVFGVLSLFETSKAPIIEKKFNDAGELVVVP